MKKKEDRIIKFLATVTSEEFEYLHNLINLAGLIRNIQRTFFLSDTVIMKRLGITKAKFDLMKVGAYDFNVMDMAKIESIASDEAARAVEIKISLDKNSTGSKIILSKATDTSNHRR